jgi:hypothetical protein
VYVAIAVGGVLLYVLLMMVGWRPRPSRYEIPAGYRGWVLVRYDEPTCPPLESRGLYLVIQIDASGMGCTSSDRPGGVRYVRYEYVADDGTRTPLPSTGWGQGGQIWAGAYSLTQKRAYFFVGSEEELKRSWGEQPR